MPQAGESRVNPQPFRNSEAATTIKRGHVIKLGTNYGQAGNDALLNIAATTNGIGVAYETAAPGAMFAAELAPGAIVPVQLGTGGATRGVLLTSEGDGDLIVTVTSGQRAFIMALEAGADQDVIEGLFLGLFIVP